MVRVVAIDLLGPLHGSGHKRVLELQVLATAVQEVVCVGEFDQLHKRRAVMCQIGRGHE